MAISTSTSENIIDPRSIDLIKKAVNDPAKALDTIPSFFETLSALFKYPTVFYSQAQSKLYLSASDYSLTIISPPIETLFTEDPQKSLFSSLFFFQTIQNVSPLLFEAFEISKLALQILFKDVFESFIMPLSETARQEVSVQGILTLGVLAVTFLTHEIGIRYLKEDPKVAEFITYGAVTGALSSFIVDQDVCIGTMIGAFTGLITDTVISFLTKNSTTIFFKNQYQKLEEKAKSIQKIAVQVFPYLVFTLGTALVYRQIKPILLKSTEELHISSQKIYTLKAIALSGLLFSTGQSYFIPSIRFAIEHLKIGMNSAQKLGTTFSWAPRILTILFINSALKKYNLIKN